MSYSANDRVMRLLAAGVPLTLLADLVSTAAPGSVEILFRERGRASEGVASDPNAARLPMADEPDPFSAEQIARLLPARSEARREALGS